MSKNRPSLERIDTYDKETDDLVVIIETPKDRIGSESEHGHTSRAQSATSFLQ